MTESWTVKTTLNETSFIILQKKLILLPLKSIWLYLTMSTFMPLPLSIPRPSNSQADCFEFYFFPERKQKLSPEKWLFLMWHCLELDNFHDTSRGKNYYLIVELNYIGRAYYNIQKYFLKFPGINKLHGTCLRSGKSMEVDIVRYIAYESISYNCQSTEISKKNQLCLSICMFIIILKW